MSDYVANRFPDLEELEMSSGEYTCIKVTDGVRTTVEEKVGIFGLIRNAQN